MKAQCLLMLLTVSGCASDAPMTPEEDARKYHRQATRIEIIEDVKRRKVECARAGGRLEVHRTTSGRLPPTLREMRLALCSRPGSAGQF